MVGEAQDWLEADGAADGAADGSAASAAGSPTVMLCTVILSFGVTLSPAALATVAILPIFSTVFSPPVTGAHDRVRRVGRREVLEEDQELAAVGAGRVADHGDGALRVDAGCCLAAGPVEALGRRCRRGVLVVDAVRRPALAGAAGVATADRALGGDLVAGGVVEELLAREIGRGSAPVQGASPRSRLTTIGVTLVGGDRHRPGAGGGDARGRRLTHVLEVCCWSRRSAGSTRRRRQRPDRCRVVGVERPAQPRHAAHDQHERHRRTESGLDLPAPALPARPGAPSGGRASPAPASAPGPCWKPPSAPLPYITQPAPCAPRHTPARVYG